MQILRNEAQKNRGINRRNSEKRKMKKKVRRREKIPEMEEVAERI